jgi:hypothetical protein
MKTARTDITQERIWELLLYREGDLFWRFKTGSQAAGNRAGNDREDGYVRIKIDRKLFMAHRLIWIYHYGPVPLDQEIDHIDGNPSNNRIENLRLASHSQNGFNMKLPRHSTTGLKGVTYDKRKLLWRAYITVHKKRIWLGDFSSAEKAHAVRVAAAQELHGDFVRIA